MVCVLKCAVLRMMTFQRAQDRTGRRCLERNRQVRTLKFDGTSRIGQDDGVGCSMTFLDAYECVQMKMGTAWLPMHRWCCKLKGLRRSELTRQKSGVKQRR
jgi:hypothetical protein